MSALPNTLIGFKSLPRASEMEAVHGVPRKSVVSVTSLRAIPIRESSLRVPSLFALPIEPEDARITGGTRSLDRRLLALNIYKPVSGKDKEYRDGRMIDVLIDIAAS